MDDHKRRKLEEKTKKKRRYEETEERELEAASSPLSRVLQITALSSPAEDAATLQNQSEKKENQDARTRDDLAEKPPSEKKTKKKKEKKKHSASKLEELQNHHFEDESLHKRDAAAHKEDRDMHEGDLRRDIVNEEGEIKKKKKKKKKTRENMDVDVSLGREAQEQQQQDEDQHTPEETLHTENINGEKKRRKKKEDKKGQHEEDEHSEEGNLLKKTNKEEEKRSNKKKEKKRGEGKEEKAESPSQKTLTHFSGEVHEHREEKKARSLAKENGMGEMGEVGSNGSAKEDESASSKPRKHSKVLRNTVERVNYDPASNEEHNLLNNNIECSQRPLADQLEHVTDTSMTIDSHSKEKEKGKKKEQKRKRVSFQDQMINVADQQRVRDIPNAASENSTEIAEEVWGVRFTADEDAILKDAIWKYIKSKGWDEQEGLNKVFNSNKHKDARNCWADIKLALPHRPRQAIRYRAHLLLEKGAHAGKWSEEEEQLLRRLQGEHGRKWKEISALIDRHRTSIKEKWRSLKRMKGKGVWTQGELQQLSDLVHKCLRAKALIPVDKRKPNHHILLDDINWEKIADTIGTHNHGSCCGKWYYNLQSSLVADGLWANEDDLLLLESLLESGACVEEEVEWDSLLNHRSGQVCLTRWKQMVKQLGENRTRQFLDKLDILARRYAPELLESSVKEMSIEEDNNIKENPSGTAKISDL